MGNYFENNCKTNYIETQLFLKDYAIKNNIPYSLYASFWFHFGSKQCGVVLMSDNGKYKYLNQVISHSVDLKSLEVMLDKMFGVSFKQLSIFDFLN